MEEGSSFSFFDLPNDQLARLENICSDFERELRANNEPRIPEFIGKDLDEPSRLYLLSVMIPMELEYQGKIPNKKAIESYNDKYPEYSELTSKVFAKLDLTWVSEDSQRTIRRDQGVDPDLKFWSGEMVDQRYRITTLLGSGSFGVVYRAHDHDLRRDVALKVSSIDATQAIAMNERFLVEAQSSASLKSDGIATIYDVFTKDDKVFIVQEFVQGRTLDQVLASHDFDQDQAITLVTEMAKAISHAHISKIFHRDLKPSNIIINSLGQPTIVDFGLATTAHAGATAEMICGTPNYMSPEQVRGEVNRTDAKSDLWSIGVILYELLTGRKPFDAEEVEGIFDRIKSHAPKPVTHYNSDIPTELNRIVMRCLAKKKRDRYESVEHLVGELDRYRKLENQFDVDIARFPERIIPKGLRAFSYEDNDFFMQMLPGPRDFRGVPESILFWKNQIENLGAFDVFPVGMIYGASGCGKSSFVKAGLLPLLSSNIQHIYVESTGRETEIRLLKALRRKFPELGDEISLPNAIANIRDGGFLAEDEKLLIVVDQFEQWLAFNDGKTETQLLNAMRHCDGGSIQCLLLIREEYWTKAGEFMDQLEIPLVQNENYRPIELFDLEHARKLLEQFGRAYEKFDDELDQEQSDFLDKAVDELSENGRIVGARLTLFAEALRNKHWTVESLGMFGGADGVGVAFLNDTFVDSSAPQRNKMHCQAVQNCLAALLPESGSNLKGHMVAKSQLMTLSGYGNQPSRFVEMLDILDKEMRLVTSTKPSGEEVESSENPDTYYQLTHDYLVPILRRWIDSEKQRKVSGRVQARMAQVASVWSEIGHQRYLPTLSETVSFLTLSKWKDWTPIQTQMMGASVRKHIPAFVACLVLMAAAVFGFGSFWKMLKNDRFISDLLQMSISDVDELATTLTGKDNRVIVEKIRNKFGVLETAKVSEKDRREIELQKVNLAIILAKLESTNWSDVAEGISVVDLDQVPILARIMKGNESKFKKQFQNELVKGSANTSEYSIRQALSLAEWGLPKHIIEIALEAGPHDLPQYIQFLKPHKNQVLKALDTRVDQLDALVPKYPSKLLSQKFIDAGGAVGRLGAVVFSADTKSAENLIQLGWEQGYVPNTFRKFAVGNAFRHSITWRRAFRPLDVDFESNVKFVQEATIQRFAESVKELSIDGWNLVDLSYSGSSSVDERFIAVLHKNALLKHKFEIGQSYTELKQSIQKYTDKRYQVSRMCVHEGQDGGPRYSTIWEEIGKEANRTVPSFCYPSVGFVKDKFRLLLGADYADCHFFPVNHSERDWFGLRQAYRKSRSFIENKINNSSVKITVDNSDSFLSHFSLLRRLEFTDQAHQLANRFLSDLPAWTDTSVSVAKMYSFESDVEKFRSEIERVESFGFLGRGSTEIKIPCCKLRFEVSNGKIEAAEEFFEQFIARLNQLRYELRDQKYAVEIINRGLVRATLIMARAYKGQPEKQSKLISSAMEVMGNLGPRSYLYLLVDMDFDVVRSDERFHEFLWRRGYGSRMIRTWRTDDSVTSKLDEQVGLPDIIKSSQFWLDTDHMPRTSTCIYNPVEKILSSNTIWEKDVSKLTFENKKRLANAASIFAEFGQTQLLELIVDGVYGHDVKEIVPKSRRQLKNAENPKQNLD